MTYALSKFVSIPSVSSNPSHREDCRQAAIWLKKCLNQLGAESALVRLLKPPFYPPHAKRHSCLRMRQEVHLC
jgi:acetylornithine deacetylase/succinyl-diaminopimelate desuccinylase-like protein